MITQASNEEHEAARLAMLEVLGKFEHLSPPELLAIASGLVGQLVAVQDQTKYTRDQIFELVRGALDMGDCNHE